MVIANNNYSDLQIVLTPNRSASWEFNCLVLKVFGLLIFGIAIGWSLMGVWVILPFAGIEFALLVYFVYRTSADCYRKEVLHLSSGTISLERGRKSPVVQYSFDRASCEFIKTHPSHFWSAASINLKSRGRLVRVGRFLNKQDTDTLWQLISRSGIPVQVKGKAPVDTDPFKF